MALAYVSSILAAFLSMGAGYTIIPHLHIADAVEGLRELPGVAFLLQSEGGRGKGLFKGRGLC